LPGAVGEEVVVAFEEFGVVFAPGAADRDRRAGWGGWVGHQILKAADAGEVDRGM
jgi:hypothetical protein